MNRNSLNIVITNSHADNRGDEAAQRSMINVLRGLIPNASFSVLTASPTGLQLQKDVEVIRIFSAYDKKFPFVIFPFVFLYVLLRALRLDIRFLSHKFVIFKALARTAHADLVISAPGGPYFGDLYRRHEIGEHLLNILVAKLFKKPVMIYGPSMGPFQIRWRNVLRRYLLNKVEIISLRDSISYEYLKTLKLTKPLVYLTADSAFQGRIEPDRSRITEIMIAEKIISSDESESSRRPLIGITPTGARWNFRDSAHPQKDEADYIALMARSVDHIINTYNATVVFFPQLYGRGSDLPLIQRIVEQVRAKCYIRILSNKLDSEVQQAVISRMDLMIGNRYHSVIFALKGLVPTVCIAYEHKSVGVMKALKMDKLLIEIKDLTYETLIDRVNQAWKERAAVKSQLETQVEILRKRAFMNSVLTEALVNCSLENNNRKDRLRKEIDDLTQRYGLN